MNSPCQFCFNASQITPNIFLGSYRDALCAEFLLKRGITRVLNITEECSIPEDLMRNKDKIKTMQIPIKDRGDVMITKYFHECIKFIHDTVVSGEKILVHCFMGISRSATIVIAYLMRYGFESSFVENPVSYSDAINFVRGKKGDICPNFGFAVALCEWDVVGDPDFLFKI